MAELVDLPAAGRRAGQQIRLDNCYFTYVLHSDKFGKLYFGYSKDLTKKLLEHNKGRVPSTKPYRPYRLIYSESFPIKEEAVKREKELKTSQGRRFLKQYIKQSPDGGTGRRAGLKILLG